MKQLDLAIVIPTLNEEHYIGRLLDSIAKQTVKPKEIVVVDAFSKDLTGEEVQKRMKKLKNLKLFRLPKHTISKQRNFGANNTSAKHILFLDADGQLKDPDTLKKYMDEVERRRKYQLEYNKKHNITPKSISKPIRDKLIDREEGEKAPWVFGSKEPVFDSLPHMEVDSLTPMEKKKLIKNLTTEMKLAAQDLNFELAAEIRDKIKEIKN